MSVVVGLGLAYAAGALSASVMFAIFNSGSRQADDELEAKELEALRARQRAVKH
jgi:hypothetical protein